jgi:pimeloyl-ACP methyl ester carboxylesterase
MSEAKIPVLFIPALLCDQGLYADVVRRLGDINEARVMISPKPSLGESVADILGRASGKFVLVGTNYGGNLALEIALTAPKRVSALWLMGCAPGAPRPGGPDLPAALTSTPEAVFNMLGGLVVHKDHEAAATAFKTMAHRVGGAAGAAQAAALAARPEVTSRLATLNLPALVLWGADDALVPVAVGRDLADDLAHAHFHKPKDCGHLPTLEKPEESAALFAAFLEGEFHHHHHHDR